MLEKMYRGSGGIKMEVEREEARRNKGGRCDQRRGLWKEGKEGKELVVLCRGKWKV